MDEKVRVRFAPAPTGYLHVGGARTALFNWLIARKKGGTFILRVEDTDIKRSSERMVGEILDSLKWLGLDWDEGPYFQSERFALYNEAADRLLSSGKAYYCFCSAERLSQLREEARRAGRSFRYDRRCLRLSESERERLLRDGVPRAVRFLVPEGETVVWDAVHGRMRFEHSKVEDFVLKKADGSPTYHLAVVVDDHDMGVTDVIRGDDHIMNVPKQVMLYEALGYPPPRFAHLPLILSPDRSKLSKRNAAVAVSDYERSGFLPEALVNFLALLGWSPGDNREIMSKEELIEAFDLSQVSKANAVFDVKKLEWMNSEYIRMLSADELVDRTAPFLVRSGLISREFASKNREWLKRIVSLSQERVKRLTDYTTASAYFFTLDFDYDERGVRKHFSDEMVPKVFRMLRQRIGQADDFSLETIERIIRGLAAELDVKAAKVIHPTRLACTGRTVGPSLFHLLEVLGKEKVVERLDKAIDYLEKRRSG